jgi:hypothetical protein
VVVDAVRSEPVSDPQIPVNWENKWEFFENGVRFQNSTPFQQAKSVACAKNSRATELGILPRVFGNIRPASPVDGNFIRSE